MDELFYLLLGIFAVVSAFILPFYSLIRILVLKRRVEDLEGRLDKMETASWSKKKNLPWAMPEMAQPPSGSAPNPDADAPITGPESAHPVTPNFPVHVTPPAASEGPYPPMPPAEAYRAAAAPLLPITQPPPILPPASQPPLAPPPIPAATAPFIPPPHPLPMPETAWSKEATESQEDSEFSLEKFMGVKLFAWLGGLSLFLGVIYFIKYAFERNLITPELRVIIGFLTGAAMLGGGWAIHRKEKFKVLSQAFCATGVLILYGVSFASHAVYKFPLFSPSFTFTVMSVITVVAIVVAVRMDALVVAVLGMLGGFLTPVLLPTVHDNTFALFTYIALLDIGLIAVAKQGKWPFLAPAAAVGTALTQIHWFIDKFRAFHYSEDNRILIPMGVIFFFIALFASYGIWEKRGKAQETTWQHNDFSALGLLILAIPFSFVLLSTPSLETRPFIYFGYIFVLYASAMVLAGVEKRFHFLRILFGLVSCILISMWKGNEEFPIAILIAILIFALLQFAAALGLRYRHPVSDDPDKVVEKQSYDITDLLTATLPFCLLYLVEHLSPHWVFSFTLIIAALTSGLGIHRHYRYMPMLAMLGAWFIEARCHNRFFANEQSHEPLLWNIAFYAYFTLFPFALRKYFTSALSPWISSALTGLLHFFLIRDLVATEYPNNFMGLVPLAFALTTAAATFAFSKLNAESINESEKPDSQPLAWYASITLFFAALVLPCQMDHQWLLVGLAIHGSLMLWLFRRLPLSGVIVTGFMILILVFLRLVSSKEILQGFERSEIALWNWHLYTYGIAALACFSGRAGLSGQESKFGELEIKDALAAMGGILLFLLLNLQIASSFVDAGEIAHVFNFGGNFARDMTYTIAWGIFSLCLLLLGIFRREAGARYAAIGMLGITLLKLFFHDLAAIDNIYRIAALMAVSVIAFLSSFLYQKFLATPKDVKKVS